MRWMWWKFGFAVTHGDECTTSVNLRKTGNVINGEVGTHVVEEEGMKQSRKVTHMGKLG